MLKISRETDLGLLLMVEAAKRKKAIGLKNFSKENGLPYRFLSKVAVKLTKAKLLKSKEGRDGGYKLGKAAEKIKVISVVELLDGPIAPVGCMRGDECKSANICGHKSLMGKLTQVVEKQLARVSVEDIAC